MDLEARRAYARNYYWANREKLIKLQRKRNQRNRTQNREYAKKYRESHPNYWKEWAAKNPNYYKDYHQKYHAQALETMRLYRQRKKEREMPLKNIS